GVDGAGGWGEGRVGAHSRIWASSTEEGFDGRAVRADPGAVSAGGMGAFSDPFGTATPIARARIRRPMRPLNEAVRERSRARADDVRDDAERAGRGARP